MLARRLTPMVPAMRLAEELETTRLSRFTSLTGGCTNGNSRKPCLHPRADGYSVGTLFACGWCLACPFCLPFFGCSLACPGAVSTGPHMAPLGFSRRLHHLARRCERRADLAAGAGKGRRAGPYQADRHEHDPSDSPIPHGATSAYYGHTSGPHSSAQPAPCKSSPTAQRCLSRPKGFRSVRRAPAGRSRMWG
jgi:hypothetical protein